MRHVRWNAIASKPAARSQCPFGAPRNAREWRHVLRGWIFRRLAAGTHNVPAPQPKRLDPSWWPPAALESRRWGLPGCRVGWTWPSSLQFGVSCPEIFSPIGPLRRQCPISRGLHGSSARLPGVRRLLFGFLPAAVDHVSIASMNGSTIHPIHGSIHGSVRWTALLHVRTHWTPLIGSWSSNPWGGRWVCGPFLMLQRLLNLLSRSIEVLHLALMHLQDQLIELHEISW